MSEQKIHWKKIYNPEFLGSYSLEPGKDLVVTIKSVVSEMITGADGKKEENMVVRFMEKDVKPMVLNATNAKTIQKIYQTPYIDEWAGKKIQLFSEKVKAFGDVVEALRIRPKIPTQTITSTKCIDCAADIQAFGTMKPEQMAAYTIKNYGRALCSECATKVKNEKEKQDVNE
jgi:ribosomal protein L34E